MSDRPNFILFITDQQRADYLGCTGHPILKTPAIDSIAARGRMFERFYVANPVCQPNRATLMTGRMTSLHGVRSNGINLSLRANTFVDLLRVNGYRTALIGKSHLQNMGDGAVIQKRPEPKPGRTPPDGEFLEAMKPVPGEGPYDQETPQRWRAKEPLELTLPFYGFSHVDLTTGHGDRVGGHYYQWLRERVDDPDRLRGPDNALPHDYACPQAWRTAVPEELHSTAFIETKAIDYLEGHARDGGDAPFYAMVSFNDPHHPFTPPGKYWGMFDPADMVLPETIAAGNRAPPPHLAWARASRADGSADVLGPSAFDSNEREVREAAALTLGSITMIDDAIGRILARLEALGMADNTVVIFTADHGEFLGDHRLLLKGPLHYQSILRVPFIWADTPDRAKPGRTQALGSTLDIARTVLERADLEAYNGLQGRDLSASIAGAADDTDCVLVEDDQQRSYMSFKTPPRLRTLITQRWRMTIYRDEDWGELYDLEGDPGETENLFDDPAHKPVRAELFELMAYKLMALVDRSPLPTSRA